MAASRVQAQTTHILNTSVSLHSYLPAHIEKPCGRCCTTEDSSACSLAESPEAHSPGRKDTERSSLEPSTTLRLDRGACLIHGKEPQGKVGFLSYVVERMSKGGCLPRPSHNRATRHCRNEKPRTFLFLEHTLNKANMLCTPSALRQGVPWTQFAASTRGFSLKCAIHCSLACRPSVVLVGSQEPQWLMHHTFTVNTVLFNGCGWSACVCSLMFYL